MDERVNCMACLVADESGMTPGRVVTVGSITHAMADTCEGRAYRLCAYDTEGMLRPGMYWEARADGNNVEREEDPIPP